MIFKKYGQLYFVWQSQHGQVTNLINLILCYKQTQIYKQPCQQSASVG